MIVPTEFVKVCLDKAIGISMIDLEAAEQLASFIRGDFPSEKMLSEKNLVNKQNIYENLVWLYHNHGLTVSSYTVDISKLDIGFLDGYIQ